LVFDGFPHELGDDENYHPVAKTDYDFVRA
jgi:hypothetical protein